MANPQKRPSVGETMAPGALLRAELSKRHMSQSELARRMGRPAQSINEIINDKKAITEETALELERVLGTPAYDWVARQGAYRLALARQVELEAFERQSAWLERFPVREMERRQWIPLQREPSDQVRSLLQYFGLATFSALDVHQAAVGFRLKGSHRLDYGALLAWMRKGELEGAKLKTADFNRGRFQQALVLARNLTNHPPHLAWPEVQRSCARAGVAAVVVKEFDRMGANGVARWLTPRKALIQLNLRYRWADVFWFTFFHEAAHILMHESRRVIVELDGNPHHDAREAEANHMAEELLIPADDWERFVLHSEFDQQSIVESAIAIGVHPGIVVGRLQHLGLVPWRSNLNSLRGRLSWV